jgi:DNA gyrase inhibitor
MGLLSAASVAYGVSYDNPDITVPQKCRMDACVSLPPQLTETSEALRALTQHDEIFLRHVGNEQEYAALRIRGSYALLHPAYRSLFGMWFPQSGREPDNDYGFEIYWNSPQTTPEEELLTEICIPLKPNIA